MTATLEDSDFLTEDQIIARWPKISRAELRRARKANPPLIDFYAFPRRHGGPCSGDYPGLDYYRPKGA